MRERADNGSGRRTRRDWRSFAVGAAAIVVVGLIALWPVLRSDFSLWDDISTIAENRDLTPPTWSGWLERWTKPHMNIYVPVTHTAWTAIAWATYDGTAARPLPPWPFKLASVVAHLATSVIVFAILRRAVGPRWPALAGALFFCVHPLQVESVAWTSGLKDLLCGTFAATCVLIYLGDRDAPLRLTGRRTSAAIVALVLALLSKPIALTVPAALLAVDLLWLRRPTRESVLRLLPLFLLAGCCAFAARTFQERTTLALDVPAWTRPLQVGFDFAFYLAKAAWPVWLAFDYGWSPSAIVGARWASVAWALPAIVALLAWRGRRRVPLVGIGLTLAVVPLLPVSGLVYFDYAQISLVADHYLYLPMIGGAIAVAGLLRAAVASRAAMTLVAVLVLAWTGLSMRQAMTWRDAQTVALHTLRVNPTSSGTFNHLGGLALRAGDLAEAEAWQLKSIQRPPVNPSSLLSLGDIAMRKKDYPAAASWYEEAAKLTPGMPQPWYGMGQAFIANDQPTRAVAAIERGLLCDDAPKPARDWLDQIKGVMRARAATQRAAATTAATRRSP